ncbi:hypothetical protein SAQ01S_18090 [Sphingomonas aquatilis NBRC 16722]|nr:hypothetical protein SAQ01S_18090 [Sphingomonas aquatilis NBRC 16722]
MSQPQILSREQADKSLGAFYKRLGHELPQPRVWPLISARQITRVDDVDPLAGGRRRPPASLRAHVAAACQPGRAVVLAPDPNAERLRSAVRRWRMDEATPPDGTEIVVHARTLHGLHEPADAAPSITLGRICSLTSILIAGWLASGFIGAWAMGRF